MNMESCSHALVHFKEDNATEIVKIGNVMTFNVETDSAKLDTDCLHEVRFDGEVYAARVMALGSKYSIIAIFIDSLYIIMVFPVTLIIYISIN